MPDPVVFVEFTSHEGLTVAIRLDQILVVVDGPTERSGAFIYLGDEFLFNVTETRREVIGLMVEAMRQAHGHA